MEGTESITRVRIYLSERDQSGGQALYLAVLDRLQREGATGATVLRGIAGFGAGQRLRTSGAGALNSTPIVLEWVDRTERVGRVLPALDDLLGEALVTVESLRVYRAVLRASGPFGERTVGQMMQREPASARPDTPLRAALELMIERAQVLLPVVDMRGALVGTVGAADLAQRGEMHLPLRLLPALSNSERQSLLAALPERTLAEIMNGDVRSVYVESSIPQALSPLIEWGIDTLPVLDREGALVGVFGAEQALSAALRPPAAGANVRDAEPPTPVSLVMQRVVPTVPSSAALPQLIAQVLAAPERAVVVLEEGRPLGIISDTTLTQHLLAPARSAWLAALHMPGQTHATLADGESASAGALADRSVPTLPEQAAQDDAIRALLDGEHERLIVTSADGRLAGVLTRRALLRALAQAAA